MATLSCYACGEPGALRCSACASAHYCGKDCQRAHWPQHKVDCKRIRTQEAADFAAAAAADFESLAPAAPGRDGMDAGAMHERDAWRASVPAQLAVAVERGEPAAIFIAGEREAKAGRDEAALSLFLRASKLGYAPAMLNVGASYNNGRASKRTRTMASRGTSARRTSGISSR